VCGYTTTSRSGRTGRPWMETDLETDGESVTDEPPQNRVAAKCSTLGWI
jgi:hypothetical protein